MISFIWRCSILISSRTVIKRVWDIKVIDFYGQSQVGPQGLILFIKLQFKEMQQSPLWCFMVWLWVTRLLCKKTVHFCNSIYGRVCHAANWNQMTSSRHFDKSPKFCCLHKHECEIWLCELFSWLLWVLIKYPKIPPPSIKNGNRWVLLNLPATPDNWSCCVLERMVCKSHQQWYSWNWNKNQEGKVAIVSLDLYLVFVFCGNVIWALTVRVGKFDGERAF